MDVNESPFELAFRFFLSYSITSFFLVVLDYLGLAQFLLGVDFPVRAY